MRYCIEQVSVEFSPHFEGGGSTMAVMEHRICMEVISWTPDRSMRPTHPTLRGHFKIDVFSGAFIEVWMVGFLLKPWLQLQRNMKLAACIKQATL
jgi:hypothetical protein